MTRLGKIRFLAALSSALLLSGWAASEVSGQDETAENGARKEAPDRGDFIHPLCDRMISATELKDMLDPLPPKNLTIAINACHAGGFIPKLSRPGRVILTPTTDKESNGAKWPEHLTVALFPPGSNPETKFPGARIDFSRIKIDANGDGVGHFGKDDEVEADGKPASDRYLGDYGKPLKFSAAAIRKLKDINGRMNLE